MTRLDGNAIGGELFDIFGEEMTAATGTCASCGSTRPLGELAVYRQAPGIVARCTSCGARGGRLDVVIDPDRQQSVRPRSYTQSLPGCRSWLPQRTHDG